MKNKSMIIAEQSELAYKIESLLKKLGAKSSLVGFNYLRDAILFVVENRGFGGMMELYKVVAELHDASNAACERAMRHSIEGMWDKYLYDKGLVQEIFGSSIDASKGRPVLGDFIVCVARHICKENKSNTHSTVSTEDTVMLISEIEIRLERLKKILNK